MADCLEQVARLGAKLIIQTALKAEVDEFLGRARYQRADAAPTQGLQIFNSWLSARCRTQVHAVARQGQDRVRLAYGTVM